ncbi:small VCP/p97-interacting protein (plasmid) [Streptomyces longwoodensis]|uniref:hypothetical protein n=1 Tax=Streptomyces longwoodensis TaxID=68231 RepID=UPI0030DE90EC|nr:small VCP/p97-interacting protein [Streptomyces longwoodensis]
MDRRLIRTAVFGSPDSDDPALCPETPDELDAFRLEHADVTIWCGTMFEGGCGRRLTTRRCTDKICHFAHYGTSDESVRCTRTARGKDSADHLYAKAHLAAWLRTQGLTAQFTYPEPLGSALLVHLEDGRTLLVHLDRNQPADWNSDSWEIILGPGVLVPAGILNERGYVQRLRFEDRPGGGRVMRFGTEHPGQGTTWDSLESVTLTPRGLKTTTRPDAVRAPLTEDPRPQQPPAPARGTIIDIASQPIRASSSRQDDAVKLAVMHLDRALREQPELLYTRVGAIKRLLEKDHLPENVARLRLALKRGQAGLDQRTQERQSLLQQLQQTPTDALLTRVSMLMNDANVSSAEREMHRVAREKCNAEQAVRRRQRQEQSAAQRRQREAEQRAWREQRTLAREQEQAEQHALWEQHEAAREREEAERRERAEREEARRQAAALQAEKERAEKIAYLAPFVLGALKKAARERRVTTWLEIRERTGQRDLTRLSYEDRLSVLQAVEKKTKPDAPLWSAILAATGTPEALNLYRDLATLLHRPVPHDDTELLAHATADCARLRWQ